MALKQEPTTLDQISALARTPPQGAKQFEAMIGPNQTFLSSRTFIPRAKEAIAAYREHINRPSQLDWAYRTKLLGTLDELESRLERLQNARPNDPAFTNFIDNYRGFQRQIGESVGSAIKDEKTITTAQRILNKIPDSVFIGAALVLFPVAGPIASGAIALGLISKKALETIWETRRAQSERIYASSGNITFVGAYGEQLIRGLGASVTGYDLRRKRGS
ncbi:MAG: hypothetical protein ABH842_01875 [Candidatus Micrarchaeota archaeon]